jgi:hypothetical protein
VDLGDATLAQMRIPKESVEADVQDRDRERLAAKAANEKRVRKFAARKLLDSDLSSFGSPIFEGETGRPLAGYGRLMTFESIYGLPDTDPRRQDLARTYAKQGTERVGVPPPPDMARPVLVRLVRR